jgi:hypothetical protein
MSPPTSCLLATADPVVRAHIEDVLEDAEIALVGTDSFSALASRTLRDADPETLLVLDAQLPRAATLPADEDGTAALELLRQLREGGDRRPALVITRKPMGMNDVDEFCSPENRAIAVPAKRLQPSIVDALVKMLRSSPEPTWDVIEIEVTQKSAKCLIGSSDGKMIQWGEVSLGYSSVLRLANTYSKPDFAPGWAHRFHDHGATLFSQLVLGGLGPGFFSHLELAAGGLANLRFRFRVDNPSLYSIPFEATVRLSGQVPSGTPDDFNQSPFVLVYAPITRRMQVVNLRTQAAPREISRQARLLFIRSQIGENPAGATSSDTVEVPEIDQATGRTRWTEVKFRRLENIDRELADLEALAGTSSFELDLLDLSKEGGPAGAQKVLEQKLARKRYDVVHFAGHSLTTKDAVTRLVLPGEWPGQAEGMSVQAFADAAANAGARLVYLSSCQGSSANTVASLGQRGVPHVLGFRWDVDDARAAEFATLFYKELFGSSFTICEAFRTACRGVYQPDRIEASPIWASPILASRSDDWMTQRVL